MNDRLYYISTWIYPGYTAPGHRENSKKLIKTVKGMVKRGARAGAREGLGVVGEGSVRRWLAGWAMRRRRKVGTLEVN